MGLGNNRDYKTTDRNVRANLRKHAERMAELIAAGMDRAAASEQAYRELRTIPEPRNVAHAQQQRWIIATLTNDEASTDAELLEHFVAQGVTREHASQWVARRAEFMGRI